MKNSPITVKKLDVDIQAQQRADPDASHGPPVEKTYGSGLPRDADTLIFSDDQYPVWPLTPAQQRYAPIDGARMKRAVVDLGQIAIRYRDAGHKWWGRFPGTTADREGMAYMTREFERLGLTVEHLPYTPNGLAADRLVHALPDCRGREPSI